MSKNQTINSCETGHSREAGWSEETALSNSLWIGKGKRTRRAYGFDEIALVPGFCYL